jgi:chromosome segregation ATPase
MPNNFFDVGYQMGLAGEDTELTRQTEALTDALSNLTTKRDDTITEGKAYLTQVENTITKLTQQMRDLIKELRVERAEFLRQLSIEWDLLKQMGEDNATHLSSVRTKSLAILTDYDNKIKEVRTKLDNELADIKIKNEVDALVKSLKYYLNDVITNLQDQKLELLKGYGQGKGIGEQINKLDSDDDEPDAGSGSGAPGPSA